MPGLPDALGGIVSIFDGHVAVHEDQAIGTAEPAWILDDIQSILAIWCSIYNVSNFKITQHLIILVPVELTQQKLFCLRQNGGERQQVVGFIIDDKNPTRWRHNGYTTYLTNIKNRWDC